MSPLARNIINRLTALAVALLLLRGAWYFVSGVVASEQQAREWSQTHQQIEAPPDRATGTLALFATVLGLPGFALLFFAIVPTHWLYALPFVALPRDSRDDAEAIGLIGWWFL